jgi:nucleoside-triphosphatase THEP1
MNIQIANRSNAFIKIGLSGPSGSGKTYSALQLAYGLTGSYSNVIVLDTENGSANLYAHLGDFSIISICQPYTPEKYIQAIDKIVESNRFSVLIIDSLSHAWEETVSTHAKLTGNTFRNWGYVKSKYNALLNKILQTDLHVITTFRTKSDYIIVSDDNGKNTPKKVGLKSITSEGSDYEFTILFDIDINHIASCTKDRTELFKNQEPGIINPSFGVRILEWCQQISLSDVKRGLQSIDSLSDLRSYYKDHKPFYLLLKKAFEARKTQLSNSKHSLNGTIK